MLADNSIPIGGGISVKTSTNQVLFAKTRYGIWFANRLADPIFTPPIEVSMTSREFGLSVRSIAELAIVVAHAAQDLIDEIQIPPARSLQLFWQTGRQLQQRWMKQLESDTNRVPHEMDRLESFAPGLFASEMLVRTWGTVLACLDRRNGSGDLTLIARNVINGLTQVRHHVLAELLNRPPNEAQRVMLLDRFRRRTELWTDQILASFATDYDGAAFAFDHQRLKQIQGASVWVSGAVETRSVNVVAFSSPLQFPAEFLDEPEFAGLMRAILMAIQPARSTKPDASRSLMEWRIIAHRHRFGESPRYPVSARQDLSAEISPARILG